VSETDPILLDVRDGIATITNNRPEKHNAANDARLREGRRLDAGEGFLETSFPIQSKTLPARVLATLPENLLRRGRVSLGVGNFDEPDLRRATVSGKALAAAKRSKQSNSGIVLVIVLVVIVLASLAGYAFLITMQTENKAAHGSARLATLEAINTSGQEAVAAWMELSNAERAVDPTGPAAFAAGSPTPILSLDGTTVGDFTLYSPADPSATVPFESESSKLHLMTLVMLEQQNPGQSRLILMRIPGMTAEIADAILDWIDEDDQPREFGAEAMDYARMGITIQPRNGIPDSLSELLFVRGVTSELLYGERNEQAIDWAALVANTTGDSGYDTEPNPIPDTGAGLGDMSLAMNQPWCRFLTVNSAERNETFDGSKRINVNQKDLSKLYLDLVQRLPIEWADFIIFYRQYGPADRNLTASNVAGLVAELSVKPRYNIKHVWELLDARCSVPADPSQKNSKKLIIASPARLSSVATMEQVESLLDELTLTNEPRIIGRIDLMTATRPVLLAIPGIDEVLADTIIAGRDTQQGLMWLVSTEVLNLSQLISLGPYLANRGDVLRFRVKSRLPMGRMSRYIEVVWDASGEMAYQLEQRELPVEWETATEFTPLDSTIPEPPTGSQPDVDTTMNNTSSTRKRVGLVSRNFNRFAIKLRRGEGFREGPREVESKLITRQQFRLVSQRLADPLACVSSWYSRLPSAIGATP
ncbi:MAG: hypothetical protein AAF497_02900, partial [Planctomycetota bacterium]